MNIAWLSRGAATAERNRRRMHMTGLTPNGYRLWDHFEQSELSRNYPDYDAALRIIMRRTRPAAHSKASRMGITRPRGLPWDYNEIARLRRLYPSASREDLMQALPGRTWQAICRAARTRHIYRRPKAYTTSGIPLIDQILMRARERNWLLSELDEVARCPHYFRHRRWRNRLDYKVIALVVDALGGHLNVRWAAPVADELNAARGVIR